MRLPGDTTSTTALQASFSHHEGSSTHTPVSSSQLDQEASNLLRQIDAATTAGEREITARYADRLLRMKLPPLGEGTHAVVLPLVAVTPRLSVPDARRLCVKLARPDSVSRRAIMYEGEGSAFFESQGISVAAVHDIDPLGRLCFKELIEGEPIHSVYIREASLSESARRVFHESLARFLTHMLDIFSRTPDRITSISPGNIYVIPNGGRFGDPTEFVLVDVGPRGEKDYQGLTHAQYWHEIVPERIRKYERIGYMRWLTPGTMVHSVHDT